MINSDESGYYNFLSDTASFLIALEIAKQRLSEDFFYNASFIFPSQSILPESALSILPNRQGHSSLYGWQYLFVSYRKP